MLPKIRNMEIVGELRPALGRFRWFGLYGVSVFFILLSTPMPYFYSLPLRTQENPRKSDVIVLMSSGQLTDTWLTTDAAQRTLGALLLFRSGFAGTIISSGSWSRAQERQAESQAEWLERAGVPRESVVVEARSTRTRESVLEVARIMQDHKWRTAVVVTSEMDVPRVRLAFRKVGVEVSFLAVPEFKQPRSLLYFPAGMGVFYHATYEYAGLVLYKLKGWI
jgi:uncharacterized SAM-binding protein YcdF (DUF218 family)